VSEDQVFSEPILKDFERETGITVKSVFDTEESKSTGVMNRLIAEKDNPQADVYWANEPVRAEALKQRGVSTPYTSASAEGIADQFKDPDHHWTGFSARARVLLVNARSTIKPVGVVAYTEPSAKGHTAIANPLFGTTTDYVAARKVFCCLLCCRIAAKIFVIEYQMKSPVVFGDVENAYAGFEEVTFPHVGMNEDSTKKTSNTLSDDISENQQSD
jgi:hypothetical protein